MKTILLLCILTLLACRQKETDHTRTLGKIDSIEFDSSSKRLIIRTSDSAFKYTDTIFVHDTITVSDESDIETIKYYKNLSALLWRAVTLVQQNSPKSDSELSELNKQIVSEREKHNRYIFEELTKAVKRIASSK